MSEHTGSGTVAGTLKDTTEEILLAPTGYMAERFEVKYIFFEDKYCGFNATTSISQRRIDRKMNEARSPLPAS